MGHSSPMITLKTYSHWLPDTDSGEAHAYAASFLSGTPAPGTRSRARGRARA
jgi:hypothetical protein